MGWLFGIDTGSGVWNALVLVIFLLFTMLIAEMLRRMGVKGYRRMKHRGKPFYFGNEVSESSYVKASDIYWGFVKAMEKYYRPVIGAHTGNVNDYMAWLVLSMAGILLLVFFF